MTCPVHDEFDPLGDAFLRDPLAVDRPEQPPVFYAPSLDYYVVTRYADIERVFLDPETFSAANAQLPLVALAPEVGEDPARRRPQAAAVDGQPRPARARAAAQAGRARVHAAAGEGDGAAHPRHRRRAARRGRPDRRLRPDRGAGVPAADADHVQLHGRARGRLAAAEGVVRSRASLAWGRPTPDEALHHAQQMVLYRRYLRELVPAKADDRGDDFASALLEIQTRTRTRSPTRRSRRSCSRSRSPATRPRTT